MKKKPKISVIIPALNEEKYIHRPLDSLKKQKFRDYEVVVVADSCTDKTVEITKKRGCRVVELNTKNIAHNRNQGAKHAKADVLLFIDADVRFEGEYLQLVWDAYKEGYKCGRPKYTVESKNFLVRNEFAPLNWFKMPIFPHTYFVTKKLFKKIKGYDEQFKYCHEDTDISRRIVKQSKPVFIWDVMAYNDDRRYRKIGMWRDLYAHVSTGFKYYILRLVMKIKIKSKWHMHR